jgi:hypothetical protein
MVLDSQKWILHFAPARGSLSLGQDFSMLDRDDLAFNLEVRLSFENQQR